MILRKVISPAGKKRLRTQNSMKKHLIIYAKRPLPGYAKTRVGSAIGMEASAGVYARMLYSFLFDISRNLGSLCHIELSVASPEDVAFFQLAFPELKVRSQIKGDLGERMANSFQQAFDDGAECAVLTGSDIPGLNSSIIAQAFTLLVKHQVVIGPATDGGYYLIGMQTPGAHLFNGIAWSTNTVLAQTVDFIKKQGMTLDYLPTLSDMDNETEFVAWQKNIKQN